MSDTAKIAAALVAFQAEMPTVAKGKRAEVPTKSGGKYTYTYADLADVTEAAMPILSKHGLAFVSCPRRTEQGGYEIVGTLLHTSGETLTGALPLSGGTEQTMGSSITYQRRYLLGAMTGLITDDDDDGRLARDAHQRQQQRQHSEQRQPSAGSGNSASQAQIKMLGALMSQNGMTDRDAALAFVADTIGRQVGSRNELTAREASRVIDALQALDPPAANDPAREEAPA